MKNAKHKISARRVVFTSLGVDILDVVMNSFAAIVTGSIVMIAETLQGFSDLLTDIFLIVGLKTGNSRSEKYSFGKGKSVYFFVFLATLVMVFFTAGITIYFGVKRLIFPLVLENLFLAYIVLGISVFSNSYSFSIGLKRIMGERRRKILKTFRESDLVVTKTTFVGDLMGVLAAVFGLVALVLYKITGIKIFDGLGAVIIGLLLLCLSLFLLNSVKEFLIGKPASKEIIRGIKKAALEIPEVRNVLDVKTMYIGLEKIIVNLDVHLKGSLNTRKIEKTIDKIKANIKRKIPKIKRIQIEVETPKKK